MVGLPPAGRNSNRRNTEENEEDDTNSCSSLPDLNTEENEEDDTNSCSSLPDLIDDNLSSASGDDLSPLQAEDVENSSSLASNNGGRDRFYSYVNRLAS